MAAITGGKEVFTRDVAFERGVVNIGSLNTCRTPDPGNWDYSVILGPQPDLAPDVHFSNGVLIGNAYFKHGVDLGSPVGIGLSILGGANSTVVGAGFFWGSYSGTFADNCVVIGAGLGAFVYDRSIGSVCIGTNVNIDSDSPECILIGSDTGAPAIFARSPHSIALISGQDAFTPSYIYHDSPQCVLLGVGHIDAFADLSFCVNGIISESSRASICFLGTVGDFQTICDNSIVMGNLSSTLSRASVVIGGSSTLGTASDASVVLGNGVVVGNNSNNCFVAGVPTTTVGDGSNNSAVFGLSTLGNNSHNSFVASGITQDNCNFSINILGEIDNNSGGSICIGYLSYIGAGVADQIAIGYDPAILDGSRFSIAFGRDLLVGLNCTNATLIGYNSICGDFDNSYGTTNAISVGANNGIGDGCTGVITIGFRNNTGPSGAQQSSNTDIYLLGNRVKVGLTDVTSHQVLGIGGYLTAHDGCESVIITGFNNEVFADVTDGIAFGDIVTIGPGSTSAIALGADVTVSNPADSGGDSCIGMGFGIGVGALCFDVTAIGHAINVGQAGPVGGPANCTDVVVVGHNINVSASGIGSQRAVAIGAAHAIGFGVYSIAVAGFENVVEYSSSFVNAIGTTIRAYHGASNNHAVGRNITLGDTETLTGRSDLIAVGSNLSIQGTSNIAIGFNLDLAGGSSDIIAIGSGSVLSGTNAISLGVNANAIGYQFVAGSTAFPYHYFSVKGSNGASALDTLVAIDNPASGATGLSVVFNNGATLASKIVKAAASPPAGSLLLYVAP